MLFGFLILLVIVGVALAVFPVDPQIRRAIYFVLALIFVLWILVFLGVIGHWGYWDGPVTRVP